MPHSPVITRLLLAALAMGSGTLALAQVQGTQAATCERTRAEVRDECIQFMRTHRWDESKGDYVSRVTGKAASDLPEGVKSRAEVRAERDAFLKAHRWNDRKGMWEPLAGEPRDLVTRSRAEVRQETEAFMRTHRWDEETESYVELRPAKPK